MTLTQSRAYQSAADQHLVDHRQPESTSWQSLAEGPPELHKSQMPVISQLQHHQLHIQWTHYYNDIETKMNGAGADESYLSGVDLHFNTLLM